MIKWLAAAAVIALLIWGAIASGIVDFGGSAEREVAANAQPRADRTDDLPQPDFAADDELLRPEGEPEPRPVMQAQVVLDRLGFSSGVIDGNEGRSYAAALRGFQRANELEETGRLDDATREALSRWERIPSTRTIEIGRAFVESELTPTIPDDPAAQAELDRLGYTTLTEKLAERFHTTPETLERLNPEGLRLEAGARVIVPNVGNDRIVAEDSVDREWLETLAMLGVSNDQPEAARIVVDKSDGVLMVFDEGDRLIAQFPATMGSEHDPLPLGEWEILGVGHNPNFSYDPDLFWDVSDNEEDATLPPGPNSPVGVVWIDLSKEHYGIHGTSEPQTIGTAQSHGCVRLTNWDAARLAEMVSSGLKAGFRA